MSTMFLKWYNSVYIEELCNYKQEGEGIKEVLNLGCHTVWPEPW
jgi:hypothetical protein